MRSVSRTLRDVKLRRLLPGSAQFPGYQHLHPWISHDYLRLSRRQKTQSLPIFRALWTSENANIDLVVPGDEGPTTFMPASWNADIPSDEAVLRKSSLYGRWQWLLTKPERLLVETDFDRKGPAKEWRAKLLVDHPDNHGDFELWGCLLDQLQRMHGDSGVWGLWYALWGRKCLFRIDSPPARLLWQTILDAAVRLNNEKFLDSVWIYAEWMNDIHDTKWPKLYTTIVSHFLSKHDHKNALRWHMRLTPNFYPGSETFANIIRQYSSDRVLNSSLTLHSLYVASPERNLYDILVPHLYNLGYEDLARGWRRICLRHNDEPKLHSLSRPFLRYMAGFWHEWGNAMSEQELIALERSNSEEVGNVQAEVSREFMNRVHGATFGISAKTYNDSLGARWFATSWVSLDTATSVIAALGIKQIGPLSLQSIALREGTAEGFMARLAHLEELRISIPDSSYVNTLRYFAKMRDEEFLFDILECDLHPDVFDDIKLHGRLMDSSAAAGNWSAYKALVGTRLATIDKTTGKAANMLLQTHILQGDYQGIQRVLDDMRALKITLNKELSNLMFKLILDKVPRHPKGNRPPKSLIDCISICRQLSSFDVPVPVICWKTILYCLGRLGRLNELHELCLELLDYYTKRRSARPGFVPVHLLDLPESMTEPVQDVENLMGLYIPSTTPPRLPSHPLFQLFDSKFQGSMTRWAFRRTQFRSAAIRLIGDPDVLLQKFQITRTINLFRQLQNRGFNKLSFELELQKALIVRLAELYGSTEPWKGTHKAVREANVLTLAQMKTLCDEAWGHELLPPLEVLESRIATADAKRLKTLRKWAEIGTPWGHNRKRRRVLPRR